MRLGLLIPTSFINKYDYFKGENVMPMPNNKNNNINQSAHNGKDPNNLSTTDNVNFYEQSDGNNYRKDITETVETTTDTTTETIIGVEKDQIIYADPIIITFAETVIDTVMRGDNYCSEVPPTYTYNGKTYQCVNTKLLGSNNFLMNANNIWSDNLTRSKTICDVLYDMTDLLTRIGIFTWFLYRQRSGYPASSGISNTLTEIARKTGRCILNNNYLKSIDRSVDNTVLTADTLITAQSINDLITTCSDKLEAVIQENTVSKSDTIYDECHTDCHSQCHENCHSCHSECHTECHSSCNTCHSNHVDTCYTKTCHNDCNTCHTNNCNSCYNSMNR
jgi:hypothetical protein